MGKEGAAARNRVTASSPCVSGKHMSTMGLEGHGGQEPQGLVEPVDMSDPVSLGGELRQELENQTGVGRAVFDKKDSVFRRAFGLRSHTRKRILAAATSFLTKASLRSSAGCPRWWTTST